MAKPFLGNIEPFLEGSDDYAEYLERIDCIMELNKITEAKDQGNFLISVCGGDLYSIIKACAAPKKPTELTYSEVKDLLKKYFDPAVSTIAERFKFYGRQQSPDETISNYIVEIKSMSKNCKFETFLSEALRDKLVFGVSNNSIQSKLLSEKDLTFEKACEIARGMESTHQGLDMMHTNQQTISLFKHRLGPKMNENNYKRKKNRFSNYKCHVCHKMGHTAKYCRENPDNKNYKDNSGKPKPKINELQDREESDEDNGLSWINSVLSSGPVFIDVHKC